MLRHIASRIALVAAIVLSFTASASATPAAPAPQLILIATRTPAHLQRLAATGVPVYARFHSSEGAFALAGAGDLQAVRSAGLDYRVLDASTGGHSYYLVYRAPRSTPAPSEQGIVTLYEDARVAVVRAESAAMERLAETGAEIVRVTLDPKPLESTAAATFPLVDQPDPVVRWMVDQVGQDTVQQYAGDLSGEWPATIRGASYQIKTRNTNSGTPIQQATYYVGDHLRGLGLSVEEHRWGASTAPNIIGKKTGVTRPGDIFMITAHLDDMPTGATAPGADDNASGSTAVLVAADVLSQFAWDCTLRFALWTGEEQGLLGSAKYAERARSNGENILGVFNLDMIAWNTAGSRPDIDLHADGTMPATVELANQASSVVDAYDLGLIPEVRADGTGSSDHASFWDQQYTAILGIEDYYPGNHDFDPYYHKTTDTLSTLDLGYFTEYVKLAVAETAHMAGCLTTGTLEGQVRASHDGSAIGNAEIAFADAAEREYGLRAGESGQYSQAVPPGSYDVKAAAYGYDPAASSGITVLTGGATTQDFALVALAPAAPAVSLAPEAGEAVLAWTHLSPNMGYRVYRDEAPYFEPGDSTPIATLDAAHPPGANETLDYRDAASGTGDPATNHFYVVMGANAAGAGAASACKGEFDYALSRQ